MLTNAQIGERFHSDHQLRHNITLDLGKFTVSLFALDDETGAEASFAGTGTLVTHRAKNYILTASHVWHEKLKKSTQIGIPLPAGITNRYRIETASIQVAADLRPKLWNEWGPDLILLQIPREYISEISTHKTFYDDQVDGKPAPERLGGIETRSLMGTPAELASFQQWHAELTICNFWGDGGAPFNFHGAYDYAEVRFNLDAPGMPRRYGGVSGGGLWDVTVYFSPHTHDQLDWSRTLRGVAFWELDAVGSYRHVRCHGPRSLVLLKSGMTT